MRGGPSFRSLAESAWVPRASAGPESRRGVMVGTRFIRVMGGLLAFSALFGCGGTGQLGSGGGKGNSTVVLAMTDAPATLVTILSAQVTLTGATLSPGNVSILPSHVTVDMSRLQTDVAFLATSSNIPAGSYTSLNLTFANPSLTFERHWRTARQRRSARSPLVALQARSCRRPSPCHRRFRLRHPARLDC